ncbi:uncharacterized protein [Apostichopus japonicus]|uniref:uncharacterized protein n=1 Tax=Stichopus japonicus TaxID=307972 RepID=UPI003AB1F210
MSRSHLKCVNCSLFRPGRAWDDHDLCPKCRTCSRRDPCLVCIVFTPTQWQHIDTWLEGQENLDRSPNPHGPSGEGVVGESEDEEVRELVGVEMERGQERAGEREREREREEEREREREESLPPKVPALSGSNTKGKGKASASKKPIRKTTRTDSPSGSQRAAPVVVRAKRTAQESQGPARPQRETGTEIPLRRRDRSQSREPRPRSTAGSPRRGSRGRSPTRRSPRRIPARSHSREPTDLTTARSQHHGSRNRSPVRRPPNPSLSRSRSREPRRTPAARSPERGSRGRNDPQRDNRPQSRSPRRRERQLSPPSDERSPSSDDGFRKSKRRRRSPGRRQEEEPAWMTRLTGLLRPLLEGEHLRPNPDTGGHGRPTESPARTPRSFRGEDVLDCRASANLSDLEDEVDHSDFGTREETFPRFPEEEEPPMSGGTLPPELTARAAEIFRRHLGFDEPELQPQRPARVSKLTSTGEASQRPKSTMPVDPSCYDRFEAVAEKRRWTAFPAKAERAVRVPEEVWKELFKCPSIPQEAKEKLRADQGASSSSSAHIFKHQDQRKLDDLLVDFDTAARAGMKFTSVLMLTAEVLMRYHQQLPQDEGQVTRPETGQLLLMLSPLVRLAFDQFARVAVRSVKARRENVVSSIRWPSIEAKTRMLSLPSLGDDLFAGSFQQKLQEEVARRETLAKSEFRSSERSKPRPQRPRESRPSRGRNQPPRQSGRGAPRGRGRGSFNRPSRPSRPWVARGANRAPPSSTRRDNDRSSRPSFAARP